MRWARARGLAAGIRTDGAARVDRRSDPDHRVGVRLRSATSSTPASSPTSCGGRRPSSTWPTATPPRAPASVWDRRWRSALAFRGVARWWLGRPGWRQDLHDAVAMARNSDPATLALVITWTYGTGSPTGCFGPMTPRCARSRRRVQTAQRAQQRSRTGHGRVRVGCRAAVSGRRGRPSPRAGADGAGPRPVAARASSLPGPGHRPVGRPRRGPGAATAMMP